MAKLRITYTKSTIGYSQDQKDTVRSLGLRKLNSVVIQEDTPSIRGMLFKVRHLVAFEELGAESPAKDTAPRWRTVVLPVAGQQAAEADQASAEPPTSTAAPSRKTMVLSDVEQPAAEADQASAEPAASAAAPSRKTMVLSEAELPATETPPEPIAPDDLELIEGIGPKIAGILRDAGITAFAELAATSVARLEEILDAEHLNLASPETWPEQATLAAAGDLDALKQLQDQLKGGRKE